MARFVVDITCENEAFADEVFVETARILRAVADSLDKANQSAGRCLDINGNTVGNFGYRGC